MPLRRLGTRNSCWERGNRKWCQNTEEKKKVEKTFWRQIEHKNKEAKSTRSFQWLTKVLVTGHLTLERENGTLVFQQLNMVFLENIFKVLKWQWQSLPGCSIAGNYSPALCRKRLPITWFPRDEQGVAILSALLGSWCAVPGKAVACTVISCTGWYHRPSNCTNYYLSLESGKRIRSVGGTLQDALRTGKATSSQQRPGSKAASATHLPHLAPYLENPHLITQKNTPTEEIYQSFRWSQRYVSRS